MAINFVFCCFFISICAIKYVHCFIEGLYCGTENCYDVLEVSRDTGKNEISKAYRKLARKWHPDMHRSSDDKQNAAIMFHQIATAYEILRDDEQRLDYDYMLDNPEEYYSHYYRYYRRRVSPQVDVRIVIAVSITVISVIQYLGALNNYSTAISYLCKEPKYRVRAMEIARSEGLLTDRRKKRSMSKEESKQEEESLIRKLITEKMDIRGGYGRPKITDVLWVQLILFPYRAVCYACWWVWWVWSFTVRRQAYGLEEKLYLIRKRMKLSVAQFETVEDHEKADFLKSELWCPERFSEWRMEKEEEIRRKNAESSRYKSYRRYMKRGGPGQMLFGPE